MFELEELLDNKWFLLTIVLIVGFIIYFTFKSEYFSPVTSESVNKLPDSSDLTEITDVNEPLAIDEPVYIEQEQKLMDEIYNVPEPFNTVQAAGTDLM